MPEAVSDYFLKNIKELKTGCVHSVFSSSFNLKAGEFLIHAGSTESPLSCLGFSLSDSEIKNTIAFISQGDLVRIKNNSLSIYNREKTITLSWDRLPVKILTIKRSKLDSPALRNAICAFNPFRNTGLELNNELIQALNLLKQISDEDSLKKAIHFLKGRGKGLTPSGDDILTGFCAGMWAFGDPVKISRLLKNERGRRTTDVSSAYLRAVSDGYVNEDFQNLFNAVKAGKEEEYPTLIEAISQMGHTSGCDSLAGLLTAAEAVVLNR